MVFRDRNGYFKGWVVGTIVWLIALLLLGFMTGLLFYGSCRRAEIFNRLHQTTYSCSDFFWAGKQINQQAQTIRIGTSPPANCVIGSFFFDTDATVGQNLYLCVAPPIKLGKDWK